MWNVVYLVAVRLLGWLCFNVLEGCFNFWGRLLVFTGLYAMKFAFYIHVFYL